MILRFQQYINEKILNKNQLNLWDDAFSAQTIIHTLLDNYKAAPILQQSDTKTIGDVISYLENNRGEAISSIIDEDGTDSYLNASADRDDIANMIMGMDKKTFQDFLSNFIEYGQCEIDGCYAVLFEDGQPLEGDALEKVYKPYLVREWAYDFADTLLADNFDEFSKLEEIVGYDARHSILKELVKDNPTHYMNLHYYDKLIDHLRELDEDDTTLTIYRAITVPYSFKELRDKFTEFDGVGIYWSYDKAGAEAHWCVSYSYGFEVDLVAKVDVRNVNWESTLKKSIYDLSSELEIEVAADSTVRITEFSINTQSYQVYTTMRNYYQELNLRPNDFEKVMATIGNDTIIVEPIEVRV